MLKIRFLYLLNDETAMAMLSVQGKMCTFATIILTIWTHYYIYDRQFRLSRQEGRLLHSWLQAQLLRDIHLWQNACRLRRENGRGWRDG